LPFALLPVAITLVPALLAQEPPPAARTRIETADQLPRHEYPVPESATALVEDDAQFAALATQLEADLEADLARYQIGDRATLKDYYGTLASLALIDGRHNEALAWMDSVRAIEDKPALKALAGTFERAFAESAKNPEGERTSAFADAYRAEITALPYEEVQAELRMLKGIAEMSAQNTLLGYVQAQVGPAAESGEISRELAGIGFAARPAGDDRGPR
jgi:hypothetical protein